MSNSPTYVNRITIPDLSGMGCGVVWFQEDMMCCKEIGLRAQNVVIVSSS